MLAALTLALLQLPAHAQQVWRPFRPGLIYAYAEPVGSANRLIYTLRVDSTYAMTNGDSVYAFNRLLRTATTSNFPRGAIKAGTICLEH